MSKPEKTAAPSRRQLLIGGVATIGAATASSASAQSSSRPASDQDAGSVWWSELLVRDAAKARTFYSAVVGWTPQVVALDDPSRPPRAGEAEYTVFCADGREAAGAMSTGDAAQPYGSAKPPPPALPASSPGTPLARLGNLLRRFLRR